ncbi:MAG: hypothetical protein HYV09_23700 [Deltaproteobacteria bacterium]|nr:hypothetical protein [Deltaproteobacteria bacterium]
MTSAKDLAIALLPLTFALLSACGARTGPLCEGCGDLTGGDDASSGGAADASFGDARPDDGIGFDAPLDAPADRPDADPADAPPATVCPAALPRVGGPCAAPLECAYPGCDPTEKDRASCVGGKWVIRAAACASPPDRCPLAIPTSGAACALPDRTGCTWSSACVANVLGWCDGGRWVLKPTSCSAPGCPSNHPTPGSACSKPPGACTYVNRCGVPEYADCVDGRWRGEQVGCELDPECPPAEPPNGSPCTPGSRPLCVWKDDCGGFDYGRCGWYLGEGRWTIFRPPCPATSCPSTPTSGSSCGTPGQACTYPSGGGCTIRCSCASGVWTCVQDACGA